MNLEENKKRAIAFYKTSYEGNPGKAIEKYVGDDYIQHNPSVANGTEGFIEHMSMESLMDGAGQPCEYGQAFRLFELMFDLVLVRSWLYIDIVDPQNHLK